MICVSCVNKLDLGFGSLRALNLALLTKWIWRLDGDKSNLWLHVIKGLHNLDRKSIRIYAKKTLSGIWSNIVKVGDEPNSLELQFDNLFLSIASTGEKGLFR